MSTSPDEGVPLVYRFKAVAAENLKASLAELRSEMGKNQQDSDKISKSYRDVRRATNDVINSERVLQRTWLAQHQNVLKVTRAVNDLNSVFRTVLAVQNAINIARIAFNTTIEGKADLEIEQASAERDLAFIEEKRLQIQDRLAQKQQELANLQKSNTASEDEKLALESEIQQLQDGKTSLAISEANAQDRKNSAINRIAELEKQAAEQRISDIITVITSVGLLIGTIGQLLVKIELVRTLFDKLSGAFKGVFGGGKTEPGGFTGPGVGRGPGPGGGAVGNCMDLCRNTQQGISNSVKTGVAEATAVGNSKLTDKLKEIMPLALAAGAGGLVASIFGAQAAAATGLTGAEEKSINADLNKTFEKGNVSTEKAVGSLQDVNTNIASQGAVLEQLYSKIGEAVGIQQETDNKIAELTKDQPTAFDELIGAVKENKVELDNAPVVNAITKVDSTAAQIETNTALIANNASTLIGAVNALIIMASILNTNILTIKTAIESVFNALVGLTTTTSFWFDQVLKALQGTPEAVATSTTEQAPEDERRRQLAEEANARRRPTVGGDNLLAILGAKLGLGIAGGVTGGHITPPGEAPEAPRAPNNEELAIGGAGGIGGYIATQMLQGFTKLGAIAAKAISAVLPNIEAFGFEHFGAPQQAFAEEAPKAPDKSRLDAIAASLLKFINLKTAVTKAPATETTQRSLVDEVQKQFAVFSKLASTKPVDKSKFGPGGEILPAAPTTKPNKGFLENLFPNGIPADLFKSSSIQLKIDPVLPPNADTIIQQRVDVLKTPVVTMDVDLTSATNEEIDRLEARLKQLGGGVAEGELRKLAAGKNVGQQVIDAISDLDTARKAAVGAVNPRAAAQFKVEDLEAQLKKQTGGLGDEALNRFAKNGALSKAVLETITQLENARQELATFSTDSQTSVGTATDTIKSKMQEVVESAGIFVSAVTGRTDQMTSTIIASANAAISKLKELFALSGQSKSLSSSSKTTTPVTTTTSTAATQPNSIPKTSSVPSLESLGLFGVRKAATGMDSLISKPTLILAGEGGGAEQVKITPAGKGGGSSGGTTIINNYYTIQGSVWSERELFGTLDKRQSSEYRRRRINGL